MPKIKTDYQQSKDNERMKSFKGGLNTSNKLIVEAGKAIDLLYSDAKSLLNEKDSLKFEDLLNRLITAEVKRDLEASNSIKRDLEKLLKPYEKA